MQRPVYKTVVCYTTAVTSNLEVMKWIQKCNIALVLFF